jgi:MSHA biogenesis protein MshI
LLSWPHAKPKPGWVAMAPQGDRVRVVNLVREEGRPPAVRWACTEPWEDPPQTLRALRRSHPLRRQRKVVVLERGQYQVLVIDTPDVPREEWRDAARWRLKDMVDFAVDSAGVDLLELAVDPQQRRHAAMMVVAAPRAALAACSDAGADAGLRWEAIDVPETALRNACLLCAEASRAEALLFVGSTFSTLVITAGGELLATRDIGAGIDRLADPDPVVRQQHYERVGLELQRTLDNIDRQFSQANLARLQIAPGPSLRDFIAYVREIVSVPVAPFEFGAALDLSAVPELADPHEQAAYLPAIGAALR